jgi:hypothetical protein
LKIAIACPFYGNTPPLVGDSQRANIINAWEAGVEVIDDFSTSGTQHRNACEAITARAAKDEKVDAVFWTEHDVILPPFAISQLVKTLEEVPEADMATGILFRRCKPYSPIISFRDTSFSREQYEVCRNHDDPNLRRVANAMTYEEMADKMLKGLTRLNTEEPPFPCDTTSFGAVLFRRKVLQRMAEVPDAFAIDPMGLFSIDSIFFMRVKDQGFKLYCNPKVLCGHLGDQEIIDWQKWTTHITGVFEKLDVPKQEKLRAENPNDRIYGELTRLANKYKTDKGTLPHDPASGWMEYTHNYCDFYESMLAPMRLSAKRVLEIGVWHGASLKMWRDYFPNAHIYGMDVEDCKQYDEERVTTLVGDQAKREHLRGLPTHLDLIVDDGGHSMEQQQVSLAALFPHVKPGGYYILEDLHTSFMGKEFGVDKDGSNATIKVVEALSEGRKFNSEYMSTQEIDYLSDNVASCIIYGKKSMTCIMRKR